MTSGAKILLELQRHDSVSYDFFTEEKKKGKQFETHYQYGYYMDAQGFINIQYGYRIGEWDSEAYTSVRSFRTEMINQATTEYNDAPMIFVIPKDDFKTFVKAFANFEQDESKTLYFFHDWVRHLVKTDRSMRKQYKLPSPFKTMNALIKSRSRSRTGSQIGSKNNTPSESDEDTLVKEETKQSIEETKEVKQAVKETKHESGSFEDCKDCQEKEPDGKRKPTPEQVSEIKKLITKDLGLTTNMSLPELKARAEKYKYLQYYAKFVVDTSTSMMDNVQKQFQALVHGWNVENLDFGSEQDFAKLEADLEKFVTFAETHRAKLVEDVPEASTTLCKALGKMLALADYMTKALDKIRVVSKSGEGVKVEMEGLGKMFGEMERGVVLI